LTREFIEDRIYNLTYIAETDTLHGKDFS
jgi:hypothetical protein